MFRNYPKACLIIACFVLFLAVSGIRNSWGQALPVQAQPSNVNRLISGTLQEGFRTRGFAMNDPRFGNTIARVGPALSVVAGGGVAAVTIGAVTAPAWASIALGVAVGTVVTYAVTLAVDGLVSWLFGTDTVDVISDPVNVDGAGIVLGGAFWSTGGVDGVIYGGDGLAVARQGYSQWANKWDISAAPSCTVNASIAICTASEPDVIGNYLQRQALYYSSGAPSSCLPGNYFIEASGCVPYRFPNEVEDLEEVPLQTAVEALPDTELDKPLNPAIGAALANRAWQLAAVQPGYDGLPYSQSSPISEAEVLRWMQLNPEFSPTVRDFTYPNPDLSPGGNPWFLPSNPTAKKPSPALPNQETTNPGVGNPIQNLGPDPGIGAPQIEQTPTAEQIIAPLRGLFSDVDSFIVPTQSGECPRPSIEVFGQTFVMSSHCELLDGNLDLIRAASMIVFALASLFIVLRA